MPLRIGMVAGEASGDLLGAAIIRALKHIFPDIEIIGVAGVKMLEAGATTLFALDKLSVMGITEVLSRARELLQLRSQVRDYFLNNPPDIYIGIDSPDFNLPIEFNLKKAGIKTIHCNSPTIWAWRKNRIHKIGRSVDLMLTLFPFEAKYYEAENIPVKYIGHPLADIIPIDTDTDINTTKNITQEITHISNVSSKKIALLPGSRAGEIKYIGPVLLKAAELIWHKYPDMRFISPMINQNRYNQFEQQWKTLTPHLPLSLEIGKSQEIMKSCDIIALASGTATLEAMLINRPMVVLYKSSFISYWIVKKLIQIKQVSLPNILANEILVPEFIQHQATPENIANSIENYLLHPEKITELQNKFFVIHKLLQQNAAEKAAEAIRQLL
jgi:lipid-A-disaccharide synthase